MRRINPSIWFFIVWFLLQTALGQWKHISSPPEGMHQGAQADRACVAWNYYHESMNFFQPRVSEIRAGDGVAGMEFPLVNYSAAIFYNVFGFHEFWYRILVFLIVTFGVFAAFSITGFFMQKTLHRLVLVFGWYLSPVMVFYSANFIPDPVALSFSLMAWYFFLRYYFNFQPRKSLRFYMLFTALCGLIKVTFLISHFSVAGLYLLYRYRPAIMPLGFPSIRRPWLYFSLPLLPVAAWYGYSRWLTNHTGNIHFLQQINPANNFADLKEFTRFGFNTWQDSLYNPNYVYIMLILIVVMLFGRLKESPVTGSIAAFLLIGFTACFLLFNGQFRYHDYYYILLYPALFFGMLFLQQIMLEQRNIFMGILPVAYLICFFILPYQGFQHSKKMLANRYEEGNYFSQEIFTGSRKYVAFGSAIQPIIPAQTHVISAFDPSPNTTLYLLRRRGIRIAKDFSAETTRDIMQKSDAQYLIVNDTLLWDSLYEPVVNSGKKVLYRNENRVLYQIKK